MRRALGLICALALASGVRAEPAAAIAPVASLPLTGGTLTGNVNVNKNAGALPAPYNTSVVSQFLSADGLSTWPEIDSFGGQAAILGKIAAGTNASPSALTANSTINGLVGAGYDGVGYYTVGQGRLLSLNNWSSSDHSTYWAFTCVTSGLTTLHTCGTIDGLGFEGALGQTTPAAVTATTVIITTLPTSDPHVVGELWNSSGAVHVSAG